MNDGIMAQDNSYRNHKRLMFNFFLLFIIIQE